MSSSLVQVQGEFFFYRDEHRTHESESIRVNEDTRGVVLDSHKRTMQRERKASSANADSSYTKWLIRIKRTRHSSGNKPVAVSREGTPHHARLRHRTNAPAHEKVH